MRQIEFRAKDENGFWVYGSLVVRSRAYGTKSSILEMTIDPTEPDKEHDVKYQTIGQFTGLLDKNGVKIWDGDKFQDVFSDNIGVVKFGAYHHCFDDKRLIEFGSHVGFYVDFENGAIRKDLDYWAKNREVVGNIHDVNPQVPKEG